MKYLTLFFILISFSACKKVDYQADCGALVTLSAKLFNNVNSNSFSISNVEINGNCIDITLIASGCDGKSWKVDLIDSKFVAKSKPSQKNFKIVLENPELCLSIVSRTFTFDVKPSSIGADYYINLESWSERILVRK